MPGQDGQDISQIFRRGRIAAADFLRFIRYGFRPFGQIPQLFADRLEIHGVNRFLAVNRAEFCIDRIGTISECV